MLFLYHSPSTSKARFLEFLQQKIDDYDKNVSSIVIGDFNIDTLNHTY